MKVLTIIASTVLALSACAGGSQEPAETATVTESAPTVTETAEAVPEPAPAPETITETAEPEPVETYEEPVEESEDLDELAMQMTWDEMTLTEQDDICYGWRMDPDMMYGFFTDGAGEDTFPESAVRAFFDEKCL